MPFAFHIRPFVIPVRLFLIPGMLDHGEKKALDLDVSSDAEFLYGEMAGNPLESFNTGLPDLFQPVMGVKARCDFLFEERDVNLGRGDSL